MKIFSLKFNFIAGLVLCLLAIGLVGVKSVSAKSYECNSLDAKWNRDYLDWPNANAKWVKGQFKNFILNWDIIGGFKCQTEEKDSAKYFAYIDECTGKDAPEDPLDCEDGKDCANVCGKDDDGKIMRCMRKADCEGIGGVCISDGSAGAPRQSDVDCQTGITKGAYSVKGSKPTKWQIVRFRCPKKNKMTCWKKVPEPPETTPETVYFVRSDASTTTTPVKKQTVINVTDCCRNIVPKIDHQTEEYTLNHVIQTAINIYECILCIVGALILIMLVAGSFMIMISAGNDNRVASGKKIIAGAVVGGIIVFFSFLIVNFTVKALGAQFVSEPKVEINPQGPSN